jgi:predicted membrane-bound spermidine synthase
MNRTKVFLGIGLTTLSTLILELSLTRLFSATMYYHFAFMAISLALFGSGASGVFIYLIQEKLSPARTGRWLSLASALFAITTVFAMYVILSNPLLFAPEGLENYYRLAKIYGATTLPFFFAGCAVTLAITRLATDISRLYLFDLVGAALGCLLLIPILDIAGAINTLLVVSVLSSVAAVLFSTSDRGGRVQSLAPLILFGLLIGLVVYNKATNRFDVRQSKGFEETRVLFSKWNSFSRVTVETAYQGKLEIKIDADAATGITENASDVSAQQAEKESIAALAYHLRPNGNVLIIGPGGGNDVMAARVFGARSITAVEINPIIARDIMSSEPFRSYSGDLFQQPEVRLEVDEGRSFIRRSQDRYDVLQATMVDTWAATAAGAFALTENNLYTVEAFKDYVEHLKDDGLLTMTRWYFEPPDQLLRLLSIIRVTMSELGIDAPDRHIMLIRDDGWGPERSPATLIFKRAQFTDDEVRTIESVARANGFELLYTPLTRPDSEFTRMIEAADPADVWNGFETNVEPTRDNNPFFFNSIRLTNLGRALKGANEWQKTNLGTFVLFALLGITTVMVLLFIIGPLLLIRKRAFANAGRSGRLLKVLYFGALGAGFIIVEVAMIQKFILFLGHPVYALAVVLFSLLLFSGAGSYLSGRFPDNRLSLILPRILIVLIVLVLVYIVVLPPIFYGLVHLAHWLRIALAVILMSPLAIVMGMPMPMGIRMLASSAPEIIPWAWGVNGATSVMGSVAALAIAILTGFNQALIVGSLLYLLAVLLARKGLAVGFDAVSPTKIEQQVST